MYGALSTVLRTVAALHKPLESWIVCLTDGQSADNCNTGNFRQRLMSLGTNVHMITIGINLCRDYEHDLRQICHKYEAGDPKGFFVRSDGTTSGMDAAFDAVKRRIPVSQTFDLDGRMTDDECRQFIRQYLPSFVQDHDMISCSFWVAFLYRRVKVFDNNNSFNYNEKHDSLGSSLMKVMLTEAERLLDRNLRRDWLDENHTQLIYDFSTPDAPEFRLICTAPDRIEPSVREELSSLDLPGFVVPTRADLEDRATLDRFLAQALDIPLQKRDDDTSFLSCVDEYGFILTLDFTMKLLSIHERIACSIPCIIEGETGVSKSALTKMYSFLRNSSIQSKLATETSAHLGELVQTLRESGIPVSDTADYSEAICFALDEHGDDVAGMVLEHLEEQIHSRSPIFAAPTEEDRSKPLSQVKRAFATLKFFESSKLEQLFFDVNVDSSLTEKDFVTIFRDISHTAQKVKGHGALVVVFLDGRHIRCVC